MKRNFVSRGALLVSAMFVVVALGGGGATAIVTAGTGDSDIADSGGADASTDVMPTPGGTLTYAARTEVASWRPSDLNLKSGGEDRGVYIYDTLLILQPDGQWIPNIATAIESNDGISWEMTLRPDVRFTDGTPLDAEAVVYNVEQVMDPANASGIQGQVAIIDSMTVLDPLTVQFDLKSANGSFPIVFTSMAGMIGSPTAMESDPSAFGERPVGAGPFMLESWVRDSTTRLVRNPDYWDAPKPYLDAVDITIVPDATARAQSVIARETDLAINEEALQSAVTADGGSDLAVFTLISTGARAIVPNQDIAPFDDVRVREAMALSWDYAVVNEFLALGGWPEQELVCPPFDPGLPQCEPGVWPQPDMVRAKELLQDYLDDGNTLGEYEILAGTTNADQAEFVQQQLGDLGIETTIRTVPTPEYIQALDDHAFEIVYNNVGPFAGVPTQWYNNLCTCRRDLMGGTPNLELDEAIQQSESALTAEERTEAFKEVQEINARDFNYLWYAPSVDGMVGKSDVILGDRYPGSTVVVAQDIWLDR